MAVSRSQPLHSLGLGWHDWQDLLPLFGLLHLTNFLIVEIDQPIALLGDVVVLKVLDH
jgi:hypothetical protein